jgi:hypothetical protein
MFSLVLGIWFLEFPEQSEGKMSNFYDELAVRSSFIRKIGLEFAGFDIEIHVTTATRATYVYIVSSTDYWHLFKQAVSKGKYYNQVIKRRFDFVRKY